MIGCPGLLAGSKGTRVGSPHLPQRALNISLRSCSAPRQLMVSRSYGRGGTLGSPSATLWRGAPVRRLMGDPHGAALARASERYRLAHATVADSVRRHFGRARRVTAHGMPGWIVPRPPGAAAACAAGTFDPRRVFVGLVERKRAITLHLWHPGDPGLIAARREALRRAGLVAMVGCVTFARQGPYPSEAIDRLLAAAARVDAAGARPGRSTAGRSRSRRSPRPRPAGRSRREATG